MYPGKYSAETPEKLAVIDAATDEVLTYKQLDEQSAQLARYLRTVGLQRGDTLALNLENCLEYFVGTWAALRSGLFLVTVNRYLPAHDVAYIIQDSGARNHSSSFENRAMSTLPRAIKLVIALAKQDFNDGDSV